MTLQERAHEALSRCYNPLAGIMIIDPLVDALRDVLIAENEACERIAWEYARGLRQHSTPPAGSTQQADHIAADIAARRTPAPSPQPPGREPKGAS